MCNQLKVLNKENKVYLPNNSSGWVKDEVTFTKVTILCIDKSISTTYVIMPSRYNTFNEHSPVYFRCETIDGDEVFVNLNKVYKVYLNYTVVEAKYRNPKPFDEDRLETVSFLVRDDHLDKIEFINKVKKYSDIFKNFY